MGDAITKAKRSHAVQAAAGEIVGIARRDKGAVAISKVSRILASVADHAIQEERQDWIRVLHNTKGVGPKTREKLYKAIGLGGE